MAHGNKNYTAYLNSKIITTKFQLMELHYTLLRVYGEDLASQYYNFFKRYSIEVEDYIILKANLFRYIHKRQKLSYIDCVGYIIAQEKNIKFLTGDIQFKDLPNVEFVK